MKTAIAIFLFTFFHFIARSQSIQWQRCLGGMQEEDARSIIQTSDSGYIVAGYTFSNDGDVSGNHGYTDAWIVKLTMAGSIQWRKCFGGTVGETANCICQTNDSGYIFAGASSSNDGDAPGNHGQADFWIVKLSAFGNIQWQRCLGGANDEEANAIVQTADGGYIVAGYTLSGNGDVSGYHGSKDYWVVKLSDTGGIQWQRCYGGGSDDIANSICQAADGGYYVAGYTSSQSGDVIGLHTTPLSANPDFWVLKLSPAGSIEWQRTLGGTNGEEAYSVRNTPDGGCVVAGYAASTDGDVTLKYPIYGTVEYWIVKLSPSGTIDWQKSFGSTHGNFANSINTASDGGYLVAGRTTWGDGDVTGFHGTLQEDIWVIKLSSTGELLWQKCLGGSGAEEGYSICQTNDNGYVIAGITNSIDGDASGLHDTRGDYWVVKLAAVSGVDNIVTDHSISISPNPTYGPVTIVGTGKANAKVYNLFGQLIKQATGTDNFSIEEQPPGTYFIELFNDDKQLICRDKIIKY
jgi:hypothetical protein